MEAIGVAKPLDSELLHEGLAGVDGKRTGKARVVVLLLLPWVFAAFMQTQPHLLGGLESEAHPLQLAALAKHQKSRRNDCHVRSIQRPVIAVLALAHCSVELDLLARK